jgi:hypothetical protein
MKKKTKTAPEVTTPAPATAAILAAHSSGIIRQYVRGAYDAQKGRVAFGNRLAAQFRAKIGIAASTEADEDQTEILATIKGDYKRIADALAEGSRINPKNFKGAGIISDYAEFSIVKFYMDMLANEEGAFSRLKHILRPIPIYRDFLEKVSGIGPAMAGVIISEIDIHKARTPSSLWKYAGLDVGDDGQGRSRKKQHLVETHYKNREGEDAVRNGITFNPFLKTKIMGVLASSFIKCGNDTYEPIYRQYKHRLESHPVYGAEDVSKGRRHNMAMRYMVKMFLIDLYKAWRALEGLEVKPPYHEAKLGMMHGA